MNTKKLHNFKTLAYAGDSKFLKSLTDQLDQLDMMNKNEEGSQKSDDGHVISYSIKKKSGEIVQMFWAMINSDQEHYLIRADKNLFSEVS